MDISDVRRDNLVLHINQQFEGNRAAFCRSTGKNPNLINLVLSDNEDYRRGFGEKLARDIERRAGMSAGWLDVPRGAGVKRVLYVPLCDYYNVPDKQPDRADFYLTLSADDPRFQRATAAKNMILVTMDEPSMQPSINPADPVYIDLGVKQVMGDGVYVIRRSGRTELVRIQKLDDDNIRISKDSSVYQPMSGKASDLLQSMEIVGRALYVMRVITL